MAVPLSVHPHFNAEEAAAVATEFVQTLDNLPGEVTFLLQEIREKDERINQLLSRINQRHYALTKSVKNLSNPNTQPASATFPLPIPAGSAIPTSHLTPKDAQNVGKIQTEWGKIEALQDEKIRLAERLERIVTRARERGRQEWIKVGGIDIDELGGDVKMGDLGGADVMIPAQGLGTGSDRATKRRGNKGNSASVPLAQAISAGSAQLGAHSPAGSMAPPPAPRSGSVVRSTGRAGSSRPERERHQSAATTAASEPDADGEIEMANVEDAEADDTLYCFCQQKSYGEMIGCDAPDGQCEIEWFHVACVKISGPLPEVWYCPACVKRLNLSGNGTNNESRKGRKSQKK